ncbi:uncharacterized protein DNG_02992 [Cephalotrichum gorgonifer]|uniref:Uncharacterized protein n=1 Tax=Cephalotrichum gorgonifer TaxID=2041049 RepID=A0AAE8MU07_9PEZI|nr:uncharacterized protein DNG_02992 [Cephalotrichum gorgonifer]
MSIFTPLKVVVISFLTLLTFPLAILAGFTTTLAFSVLLFRVSLVYLDFILSFFPAYIFGRNTYNRRLQNSRTSPILSTLPPDPGYTAVGTIPSTGTGTYTRPRRRRPSSGSAVSFETITPVMEEDLSLMASAGMDRDFEGLGGWREGDDELWTTINSRFDMSNGVTPSVGKNHFRTLSGGSGRVPPGSEAGLTMRARPRSPAPRRTPPASPNTSKVRTPQSGGFPPAYHGC